MRIPAWFTILVIARDGIILIGSLMIFLTTGQLKAKPLIIGKITTVLQMSALFLALISAPQHFKFMVFVIAGVSTLVSGVQYIRMGGRML
jgi:phosphatidylglycerophosphate synthase